MRTKYKVTARTGYRGYAEGEEFEAELTEAEERRAIARGSIKPVPKPKQGKEKADE